MRSLRFGDICEVDAAYFRDYVERMHWIKLRSFAHALQRSGTDLAELDGSLDSLLPLWGWVLEGIKDEFSVLEGEGPSSASWGLGIELDTATSRRLLVNDWIGHYVFEQFRSIDPSTTWVVKERAKRGPLDIAAHEPVARFRGTEREMQYAFIGMISMAADGNPRWAGPDSLHRWGRTFGFSGALPVPTSPSFLIRSLEVPGADVPPRRLRPDSDIDVEGSPLGGEYYVAQWSGGELDLMAATPLSAEDVARELAERSFVSVADERRALSAAEVGKGAQAVGPDEVIVIDPMVIEGTLRGLEVQVFPNSTDQHAEAIDALNQLAQTLGARLTARELVG